MLNPFVMKVDFHYSCATIDLFMHWFFWSLSVPSSYRTLTQPNNVEIGLNFGIHYLIPHLQEVINFWPPTVQYSYSTGTVFPLHEVHEGFGTAMH